MLFRSLPLAVALSRHFRVIGFDISEGRVAELRRGEDSTREVEPAALAEAKVSYTSDPAQLAQAGVIVVAVPTPIDGNRKPDLRPVVGASSTVGAHMSAGAAAGESRPRPCASSSPAWACPTTSRRACSR